MAEEVLVYDCVRTPRGRARQTGSLYEMQPHELLASLLRAAEDRNHGLRTAVRDLLIGCVTPIADQGYNIAQAALEEARWPDTVAGSQVNRYCASGLETVLQASARIAAGFDDVLLAGGVESMSRVGIGQDGGPLLHAPDLVLSARALPQGVSADLIATKFGLSRSALDRLALRSQERAAQAQREARFAKSIVPIDDENGLRLLDADEHPRPKTTLQQLEALKPVFQKLGALGYDELALMKYPELECVEHVHTAGNSSGLVDGAALVLLASRAAGEQYGWKPRARVRACCVASSEPTIKLLGMIPATERALKQAGLETGDIDLFEVNEAFASVAMAFEQHFDVDPERINVNGGAIALGHPVGATGAVLLGTLLDELERRDQRLGLATLCAGGGQGIACVIERV